MDNDKSASDIKRLQNVILQYLRSNPDAADTLEGIMNWWLPKQRYEQVNVENVYQALEQLITEGEIKKVSLLDGTTLY
ncbi:MAG TPA: hypothetical protein DEO56_06305, partial [Nitrosomonas nitrosa]|nr:hypothetical protein [Nitrosomonas nitrosa]